MSLKNADLLILKEKKVLIVEDDNSTIEVMSDILKDDVKELFLARNALEGLEIYEDQNPDIVVTDIEMGEMNGLEMARALKEIKHDLPIIIITAYNNQEYLELAEKIKVDHYIKKPVEYNKFLNALIDAAKSTL